MKHPSIVVTSVIQSWWWEGVGTIQMGLGASPSVYVIYFCLLELLRLRLEWYFY